MLFGKRKQAAGEGIDPRGASHQQQHYRIDFDMMLKGSVYKRRSGEVRQFGVTVDGATRLVTSGDTVDKATYEALIAVGAIRDTRRPAEQPAPQQPQQPNPKQDTQNKRPQTNPPANRDQSPDLPPTRKKNEREQAI